MSPTRWIPVLLFCILPFLAIAQGSENTLDFDGVNEAVNLGDQVANGTRTIEMWFSPLKAITSTNTTPISLVARDFNNGNGTSTNEFGLCFYPTSWGGWGGHLVFFRRVGTIQHEIISNTSNWGPWHWYHVAVVIDPNDGMKMYINGVLQGDTDNSTNPIGIQTGSSTDNVSLGKWGNINIRYFEGRMDEVRFWDDARTQAEIRDNMCKKLVGNEPGLRAYYRFDAGSGTTLNDNSLNSYNGTLLNMGNTNWLISGAPVGDESVHLYQSTGWGGQTLSHVAGPGDSMMVDSVASVSSGIHIYRVNSPPNFAFGAGTPFTGNYYGVFLTDTTGNFDVFYDFSAYNCSGCNPIHSRDDNSIPVWATFLNAPVNCTHNLPNQSQVVNEYRAEFLISTSVFTLDLGNDTTICSGETLVLDATAPGGVYGWQDGSSGPTFSVTQSGTYAVTVTAGNCISVDSINVTVDPSPVVNLGNDTSLCVGNISLLLNAVNPGATYIWSDSTSDSTNMISAAGSYWVEVDLNGCIESDTINVLAVSPPVVSLGPDDTICSGDSVLLDATAMGATAYLWQTGATSATLSVTQTGTYQVTVSNGNCSSSDTVTVTVNPSPVVNLGNDTTLCTSTNYLLDATLAGATYLWQDNSTAATLTATQTGWNWVEVTVNGCSSADSVQVTFAPAAVVNLGPDTTLCSGSSLTLNANAPGGAFNWQNGSTNSTFNVTQAGTYWVTVALGNCQSVDSIQVLYNPSPTINLGNDSVLCAGQSLTLNASTPNATYLWNNSATTSTLSATQSGNYAVTVTVNGCTGTDNINLQFDPPPTINLGNDTSLCQGQSLTLDATTTNASYAWQDNSVGSTYAVTQTGVYWVTVSVNGCSGSDTVLVQVNPVPVVNLGNDTTLCPGQVFILDAGIPGATYTWQDNTTNSTLPVTQSGNYSVTVYQNGCFDSGSISVNYAPAITPIDLGPDTTICIPETLSLQVDATIGSVYNWQNGSIDSEFVVRESGTYWLEVSGYCGSESDTIEVQIEDCDCPVWIPNAFRPNGSGRNDGFRPVSDCQLTDYTFIIYNRWGQRIFETRDPQVAWDGTFKGLLSQHGVYAWWMEYLPENGRAIRKAGHVTLVR